MVVGGVCVDVVTAGTDGVRDSCAQCGRVWGGVGGERGYRCESCNQVGMHMNGVVCVSGVVRRGSGFRLSSALASRRRHSEGEGKSKVEGRLNGVCSHTHLIQHHHYFLAMGRGCSRLFRHKSNLL